MTAIINADDFGLSKSVNDAIRICFDKGYVNRTTVMTNMPAFDECYQIASTNGFLDKVGIHLVLDEGVPLTETIKRNPHFCKDGRFIKAWYAKPMRKFFICKNDRNCLEAEIEAQIKKFKDTGFTSKHIDSHHFVHTSSPIVVDIVCRIAKKYGFTSMRTIATADGENFIKRILKGFIKNKIETNFITTANFAPYKKYPLDIDDIEYMAHPDIINGDVVDVLSRKTNESRGFIQIY